MFTGLIEKTGILKQRSRERVDIMPISAFPDLKYGESIAVNGCCLTLEKVKSDGILEFFTLEETLKRTNLGMLPPGSPVNMERALRLGDRLGGHIVSGHIDGCGRVLSIGTEPESGDWVFRIELPDAMKLEVVEKGSIAVDGISLTVVDVSDDDFTVHLIPVTRKDTALDSRKVGMMVNLESDVIGKYVRRQLSGNSGKSSAITMETLAGAGFL